MCVCLGGGGGVYVYAYHICTCTSVVAELYAVLAKYYEDNEFYSIAIFAWLPRLSPNFHFNFQSEFTKFVIFFSHNLLTHCYVSTMLLRPAILE